MTGMSATTGRALDTLAHLRQSIRDILSTPIGSRVMRRDYGSALYLLVDAPMDRVTPIEVVQATAAALGRWEPRVRVERVQVSPDTAPGHLVLDLDLRYLESGAPVRLAGVVV